jgi:hypothetical protein
VYKIIRYAHEKNSVITEQDISSALVQADSNNPERDREFKYGRESMQLIKKTLVYFQIAYKNGGNFVFPMCLEMQYKGNKTTLEFNPQNSFQAF